MQFQKEKYMYYGLAILVTLFIILGISNALKNEDKGDGGKLSQDSQLPKTKKTEEPPAKQEVSNPNIRVLLMSSGYKNAVHPSVVISGEQGMTLTYGEQNEGKNPGEQISIAPDDARFQSGHIRIQGNAGRLAVASIERGVGIPSYSGIIELRATAEGIVMINELPVESYLCQVVPSEMPASFEPEALKVQAVCARSYAYRQMEAYGYPEYEAHVNDSTDYQVYGNSGEQERSNQAIVETAGQVVRYNDAVATTYYYSTSCGKTTTIEAWGSSINAENSYLQSVNVAGDNGDFEKDRPWYRWEASVPVQTLSNLVGLNTGTDVGTLQSVEITKTGSGGIALQMVAAGDRGTVTVDTENKIRRALGGQGYQITKNDGNVINSSSLLPSAFITITKSGDSFVISGGGFGHGIGMSQEGANEMAKQGKKYKEILTLFFQGVTVD